MKKQLGSALSGVFLTGLVSCAENLSGSKFPDTPEPYRVEEGKTEDLVSTPGSPVGPIPGGRPGEQPGTEPGTPPPGQGPARNVNDVEVLTLIEGDVSKLNPADQQTTRYFSLHVASNAGLDEAGLEGQRLAFKKILNSFSTKPALLKPAAVDEDRLVYKVNLDDIGMSPAEFDQVIADHYPFNKSFQDVGSADSLTAEDSDLSLKRLLQTDIFLIRMDWFNATAALPIPYAKFMRFPQTLSDFENEFLGRRPALASLPAKARRNLDASVVVRENGVNKVDLRIANIVNENVLRTGFDNSDVSFSNRIVERHVGKNGAYYISYDFLNLKLGDRFVVQGQERVANQRDLDEHNINKAPLGPKGTNASNRLLEFKHDGGEVIFMLPNGLFGYYLSDAAGNLLDKGPINVVRQNSAPSEFSLAITNGHSCMSCHNAGLLVQQDTILAGLSQNRADFLAADIARINKTYQPDDYRLKLDSDNALYLSAMKQMGLDPVKPDPVDAAFRFYNRPLKKLDIMAEMGMNERDFNFLLIDPEFLGIFSTLNNERGFVNRAVFQAIYPSLVQKFKQEVRLTPPAEADFVVNADCMDDDTVQMDTCIIKPRADN